MCIYNIKIIEYPDGSCTILHYSTQKIRGSGVSLQNNSFEEDNNEKSQEQKNMEQASRIRNKILNYCRSNSFTHFWTITFNPKEIDSRDFEKVKEALRKWLKKMREKHGKFGYIFIPERHKSGNYHFHGVTFDFFPVLVKARNPKTNKLIKQKGKQIYNCLDWVLGYSNVSLIESNTKIAGYVTKYITKEMVSIPNPPRTSRYLVSRGLLQPILKYLNSSNEKIFEDLKPVFVSKEIDILSGEITDYVRIYEVRRIGEKYEQLPVHDTKIKARLKQPNKKLAK